MTTANEEEEERKGRIRRWGAALRIQSEDLTHRRVWTYERARCRRKGSEKRHLRNYRVNAKTTCFIIDIAFLACPCGIWLIPNHAKSSMR